MVLGKKGKTPTGIKQKKKKDKKNIVAITLLVGSIVALIFLFVIFFNYLFPAVGKEKTKGEAKNNIEVSLFFPDSEERFLVVEKRRVAKRAAAEAQLQEVVEALLKGSHTGKVNCFPAGVELQTLQIDATGTASISFSSDLLRRHPGGATAELMTVYALVNTVIKNSRKVRRVRILVDGKPIASLKGHIDTSEPLAYREMQSGGAVK